MANQALVQRRPDERLAQFNTTTRKAEALTRLLQEAAANHNLVSPATSIGRIPEGCGVALSTVVVDTDEKHGEVYPSGGGKLVLARVSVDRIAAAAGISWDAAQSRRLDDGSDPRYCYFKAVGTVRDFDGTEVQLMGHKEMDLRDGSAQIEALMERYDANLAAWKRGDPRQRYEPKDPTAQIREMRLHILSHAETKARLRAIRARGLKSAYQLEELRKAFVVARLMWTGESDDPELRRMFALKQADAMLGGIKALFGHGAGMGLAQLAPPTHAPMLQPAMRPPPIGASLDDVDEDGVIDAGPAHVEAERQEATPPQKTDSAPQAAPSEASADAGPTGEVWPWQPKRQGDPEKGTPLEDIEDYHLERLADYCAKRASDPTNRYAEQDGRLISAARSVIASRGAPGGRF